VGCTLGRLGLLQELSCAQVVQLMQLRKYVNQVGLGDFSHVNVFFIIFITCDFGEKNVILFSFQKKWLRQDPMVCPCRLEWSSNELSVDTLKNLHRASVLVFTRRRGLNPKTLKP
jgi:hypothetical protein